MLSHRRQNGMLLAASYLFYGWWDYRFLGLIAISTVVDFYCARIIDQSDNPTRRRSLLTLSLVVNFSFLGFFKYYNFFAESLIPVLHTMGIDVSPRVLSILLPPGISFYTFQAVAYIVDVYHRKLKPADNFVDYALFISLFPHLIAGPIQRPDHLLPQVQAPRTRDWGKILDGVMLILTGLFRKAVIADSCAIIANAAFDGRLGLHAAPAMLVGVYAFAFQIYGDFSGYSDIARGSAQLMGFHFMVNFKQPYLSASLQEFWRRWHISLSTWLRDYLYIPLGGNRGSEAKTYRNLSATMLLGGLWHGANWTFLVWGAIHGSGLAIERFFGGRRASVDGRAERAPATSALSLTVNRIIIFHLVCLAWIFFRAESVTAAWTFLGGLSHWSLDARVVTAAKYLICIVIPMAAIDLYMERSREEYPTERSGTVAKLGYAAALTLGLLLFSASQPSAFIYFQF